MKKLLLGIFLLFFFAGLVFVLKPGIDAADNVEGVYKATATTTPTPSPTEYTVEIEIEPGSTYGKLMDSIGVQPEDYQAIYNATQDVYDLASIREGKKLYVKFRKSNDEIFELMYPINSEEELYVTKSSESVLTDAENNEGLTQEAQIDRIVWNAVRVPIQYEVKEKTAHGVIENSLYEAGLSQGLKEGTIIELANAFQWSIDFSYDIQAGDSFNFLYEERYRDGQYVMDGFVLAAEFINKGESVRAYYFEEDDENKGYFDKDGNSLQKMFLKAPVAFKYISSGFTTGRRYVRAFNTYTGHRAIDYAATYGTPIQSVGDGSVTFAGWNTQGYGNLVSIRHNATYSTNYAHQSKIIVRSGQRVKQGQTIGYVGSTGFSTGPHLHYEMVKNGVKINPLNEVLPPGEPIKEENRGRFNQEIEVYNAKLGLE